MNRVNFEDTIFILNMRIRMIRDTLRLNPPHELFLEKTLDDLEFINGVMDILVRDSGENGDQIYKNGENVYISDTEWQFSQLLTEVSLNSGLVSVPVYPEIREKIAGLRANSNIRRRLIDESGDPEEIARAEPVVSSAEFNGLLGGN